MAQLKTFRCWYHDGSMRIVLDQSHRWAAVQAQELAGFQNAGIKLAPEERLRRTKVKTVEEIDTGRKVNYKL